MELLEVASASTRGTSGGKIGDGGRDGLEMIMREIRLKIEIEINQIELEGGLVIWGPEMITRENEYICNEIT